MSNRVTLIHLSMENESEKRGGKKGKKEKRKKEKEDEDD